MDLTNTRLDDLRDGKISHHERCDFLNRACFGFGEGNSVDEILFVYGLYKAVIEGFVVTDGGNEKVHDC